VNSNVAAERQRLVDRYAAFAADEARGVSEIYERLALAIAGSPELLAFLVSLPVPRRQPNLFLAAIRHLHGIPDSVDRLVQLVRHDPGRIRGLMLSRTTQTNEPARCAVLLPLLAQLPQPLALLEVGASAGLCLLPDYYRYDYGRIRIGSDVAASDGAPIFRCKTSGAAPLPKALPRIVWRRGLDLNPIDLRSDAEVAWLETLVWPGQDERARGLRAAIDVARREMPPVVKGDLLADLEPLMATAPSDATLVVFHTAVLAYIASQERRDGFVETVRKSGAVWISNEVPGVFPSFAQSAPSSPRRGLFLMMRDGVPVAWTGPHGQSIDWFGPP
jgi:hypothetical protein